MNKHLIKLNLMMRKNGVKRAEYLKKKKVFYKQGDNCYFHPTDIPSEPFLISMHNNVVVTANVRFVTHDIMEFMFNNSDKFRREEKYKFYMGTIELFDNVFIGTNSTIMYNVKIGPNAIVAAGSVVTKDVPEGVIVGGNPAKVIGYVDDLAEKRYLQSDIPSRRSNREILDKYFWRK